MKAVIHSFPLLSVSASVAPPANGSVPTLRRSNLSTSSSYGLMIVSSRCPRLFSSYTTIRMGGPSLPSPSELAQTIGRFRSLWKLLLVSSSGGNSSRPFARSRAREVERPWYTTKAGLGRDPLSGDLFLFVGKRRNAFAESRPLHSLQFLS